MPITPLTIIELVIHSKARKLKDQNRDKYELFSSMATVLLDDR